VALSDSERTELESIKAHLGMLGAQISELKGMVRAGFEEAHRRNSFVAADIDKLERGQGDQANHCGANRLACQSSMVEKINTIRSDVDRKIGEINTAISVQAVKIAVITGALTGGVTFLLQWLLK
jgi:hypothetical protein